jgi:hypothetical protein
VLGLETGAEPCGVSDNVCVTTGGPWRTTRRTRWTAVPPPLLTTRRVTPPVLTVFTTEPALAGAAAGAPAGMGARKAGTDSCGKRARATDSVGICSGT